MKHGPLSANTALEYVDVAPLKIFLQLVEFFQEFVLLLFNHDIFGGYLLVRRLLHLHYRLLILRFHRTWKCGITALRLFQLLEHQHLLLHELLVA